MRIAPARVVGNADPAWTDTVAKNAVGRLGACRPQCGAALVSVNLFLQPDGHLSMAAPSADNTGDVTIARCVGDRMRAAAPLHDPKLASSPTGAPHGIVTYEVLLEPAS